MAGHDRRLSPIWAGAVLMMASTASAVSLTNFQPIIGVSVPISCILAYNYQIPGCIMNDFTRGNTCSDACVKGLTKIQYTVQAACPDVSADITSVLGQVLMGNLVELVCSGTTSEAPTSTSTTTSRRTTAKPTTVTVTRTSSQPPLTFTTVRSTSTTSSARTSSTTSTETDDLEIPSSTSTPPSTSTSSSTTNFDTPILTTTSQSSSTTSASSLSSSTGRSASAQPTPGDSSGGGSPFDVASSDSRQLAARWVEAMGVALGLGLLLLR